MGYRVGLALLVLCCIQLATATFPRFPPRRSNRRCRLRDIDYGWRNNDVDYLGYGQRVTYYCNSGYRLKGRDTFTCDGFTFIFPTCHPIPKPKKCVRPEDPENGSVDGDQTRFSPGQTVSFSCNRGFSLSSDEDVTCGRNGNWDREFPVCQPLCRRPRDPTNGDLRSDPEGESYFNEGERVWFSCDRYFSLSSDGDLTCQDDGTWDKPFPECLRQCRRPRDPTNGDLRSDPEGESFFNEGGRVWFSCDRYFSLSSDGDLTCQDDGTWDKPFPECEPIRCDRPDDPTNGTIRSRPRRAQQFRPGGKLWFSCDDGFSLTGEELLTCEDDGTWDEDIPECRSDPCRRPEDPENGSIRSDPEDADEFRPGGTLRYSCDEGFELDGERHLTCLEGGEWDEDFPECERVEEPKCRVPKAPLNGAVNPDPEDQREVSVGEKIWFSCDSGFVFGGSKKKDITCLYGGRLSHEPPTCVGSCKGRCYGSSHSRSCSCRSICRFFSHGCCSDYKAVCRRSPFSH